MEDRRERQEIIKWISPNQVIGSRVSLKAIRYGIFLLRNWRCTIDGWRQEAR